MVMKNVTATEKSVTGRVHEQLLSAGFAFERCEYRFEEDQTVTIKVFNGTRLCAIPKDTVMVSVQGMKFDQDGNPLVF